MFFQMFKFTEKYTSPSDSSDSFSFHYTFNFWDVWIRVVYWVWLKKLPSLFSVLL